MGQEDCILNIGLDDTDSPKGMCTTYLAYKIAGAIRRGGRAEFLDYPRLVRLNPNIPWKTRGNGAVSMRVRTGHPRLVKDKMAEMVTRYADTKNGANPGLVFFQGSEVPADLRDFGRAAVRRLVRMGEARRMASKHGLETFGLGNGRGVIGAIGAIGYEFGDSTVELLRYRRRPMFGKRRKISAQSVRRMQCDSYPSTYGSYDEKKGRVLMAPHGPDPVFYGLRGEDPASVYRASESIEFDERLDGHMIFRSNQGTGDHLRHRIDVRTLAPYESGTVEGLVSEGPVVHAGGHATFQVRCGSTNVNCAVYRPTGLSSVAMEMVVGDKILVAGGVRKAAGGHPRTVNVELIHILGLVPMRTAANPRCQECGKSMKSKGRGQGFACARCKTRAVQRVETVTSRRLQCRQYMPRVMAHRHLTRPEQRLGRSNGPMPFDESIPWISVY